jgi:prepilin-type processing-associated H-X9-DG protein
MLIVIAIIGLLVGLVMPSLSRARRQAKTTECSTRLRTLGQGLAIYANEYRDQLVPHRLPLVDEEYPGVSIEGGMKYRPTFLAMLGTQVGVAPFADPRSALPGSGEAAVDCEGEPSDRQNFANEVYVCPEVATWTDERNACYGYNYQFLGNARLRDELDPLSFKNWPVFFSKIKSPGHTVAIGDSLGTAASFSRLMRRGYEGENRKCDKTPDALDFNLANPPVNGRGLNARGNEGLVLDPPIVDTVNGEVATYGGEVTVPPGSGQQPESAPSPGGRRSLTSDEGGEPFRSGVDLRHGNKTNILWLDGRVSVETLESLGYWVEEDRSIGFGDIEHQQGNNRFWSGDQRNRVWRMR